MFFLVQIARASAPELTVVVPYYNEERYIRDAQASLDAQTEQGFDAVFLDDGSTDRSREYVSEFVKRRSSLSTSTRSTNVISGERRNLLFQRREAVRHVRTRYLTFLDADDALDPHFVARVLDALHANPKANVLHVGEERRVFASA